MFSLGTPLSGSSPVQTPTTALAVVTGPASDPSQAPSLNPPVTPAYMQFTLAGLGLSAPRNSDDCEALLAEVMAQLQSTLQNNNKDAAAAAAAKVTAELAAQNAQLLELRTLNAALAVLQSNAAADQEAITQAQATLAQAQAAAAGDDADMANQNLDILQLETTLGQTEPGTAAYASIQNEIAAAQAAIQADASDKANQGGIETQAELQLTAAHSDLVAQMDAIATTTQQINLLQSNFVQTFALLIEEHAQLNPRNNASSDTIEQEIDAIVESCTTLPEHQAKVAINLEKRSELNLDQQKDDDSNVGVISAASGLAFGITAVYGALQELVTPIRLGPSETSTSNGGRISLAV